MMIVYMDVIGSIKLFMSFHSIVLCVSVMLSEICGSPSNVSKHRRLIRTET